MIQAAKKEKVRQCVCCKQKNDREVLLRILKDHKTGEYFINPNTRKFGRSFYVCKTVRCIEDLEKNKRYRDKVEIEKLKEEIRIT